MLALKNEPEYVSGGSPEMYNQKKTSHFNNNSGIYDISIFQARNITFWKKTLGNVTRTPAFTGVRR